MPKKIAIFGCLLLLCAFTVCAQSNTTLESNGVQLISNDQLTNDQINYLSNYNFNQYRTTDQRTTIKIVNGPTIELYSTNELNGLSNTSNPGNLIAIRHLDIGYNIKRESIQFDGDEGNLLNN